MANRYQNRPFPADDDYHGNDDPHASSRGESDPLAELARLIGQTDPFGSAERANPPAQPRGVPREQYHSPAPPDDVPAAGPPPWMQRAVRQEAPPQQDYSSQNYPDHDQDYSSQNYPTQNYPNQNYPSQDYPGQDYPEQDYPSSEHPLRRYAAPHAEPVQDYDQAPAFVHAEQPLDPSRYDDALFGQLDTGGHQAQHEPAYSDDEYAYQDGYDDGSEEPAQRRGGLTTVIVVLALAVVGTGAAFAYRTYVGSPRSGEPPIIKADTSPTKIVPVSADGTGKQLDRLPSGDGTEKIVPREETPVDVNTNANSGPRMVFPPLNQNANPPSVASVAPGAMPSANAGNGTMPSNQPRKIKTFSVRGDEQDAAGMPASAPQQAPAAKPAVPSARTAAANANASTANAPMSLSPQGAPTPAAPAPHTQVATNAPVPITPSTTENAGGGGYLVQVSSQRNEADAQASYRVLQGKFPTVLGSHTPVIKRADLGEKGVYYRAMVGPFGSPEEASRFCGSLKTAGGQCVVQRN
ncbi:SPOR domain-containing protein [Bradyrhizobium canariense]|uniref:Sporulation related domain-containing protein n=1 Tax=Bradyrhizobium canariense TaxID=255045 RepID=A0A1H1PX27_9BRAD|nr:SPOR domain-containing protein [Bradyrhizobium canariense]SDS15547.1 Sporulation related domain-containing protein [Bradyrhizobium canariense]